MPRRCAVLGVAFATLAILFAPTAVRAEHCGSNLVIFGRHNFGSATIADTRVNLAVGYANLNALVCAADPEDEIYDTRLLYPGTDEISVRFVLDLGEGVAALDIELDGLGLSHVHVAANRHEFIAGTGQYLYDTGNVFVDPTLIGSVTAIVSLPDGETESVTFHTLGA